MTARQAPLRMRETLPPHFCGRDFRTWERINNLLHDSNSGLVVVDALEQDHPIIYVDTEYQIMTGYHATEVLGRNCRFLQFCGPYAKERHSDVDASALAQLRQSISEGMECRVQLLNFGKDGRPAMNDLRVIPIFGDPRSPGRVTHFAGLIHFTAARLDVGSSQAAPSGCGLTVQARGGPAGPSGRPFFPVAQGLQRGKGIGMLSSEVLLRVMTMLEPWSLRKLASASRSLRELCKSNALWRMVVAKHWGTLAADVLDSAGWRHGWATVARQVVTLEALNWRHFHVGGSVSPRSSFSACAVGNSILMFGGESLTGEALNDTYILDLSAENPCWQVLNVLKRPSARWGHTLRWLRNSWVILFGGYGPEGPLNDVHILDLEAEAKVWERVQTPSSPSPRSWHSSCMVHGSQMVVFGGKDEAGGLLNDTVVLDLRDPESACWREVDTIWRPPGVLGHSLCTTTDSKIFMFGGLQSNGSIRLRTNDVFLLDLEAVKPSWQYLSGSTLPAGRCLSGQGPSPRLEPVTGSLIGGQVLVFGGSTETGDAPCNEVYAVDPESKSPRWQRMDVSGDAPGKGWGFSACTVGNHKVVLPCGTPSGEMLLHEFRELSIVSSATPDGRQGRRAGRASATRLPSMGSSSRNPQENRAPWTHSWCPEPHQPGAAGSPAISSGVTTQLDDSTGRQDPPPAGSNEGVLAGTAPETSGSVEDTVTSPAADGEASTSGAAKD